MEFKIAEESSICRYHAITGVRMQMASKIESAMKKKRPNLVMAFTVNLARAVIISFAGKHISLLGQVQRFRAGYSRTATSALFGQSQFKL
jgi:hypothetical protein